MQITAIWVTRSAQPPASVRVGVAVPGPAGGGQHGERDEQAEPVVVDLAVAHRDDHPLEVEREDRPAEQPGRPPGRRDQGEQRAAPRRSRATSAGVGVGSGSSRPISSGW